LGTFDDFGTSGAYLCLLFSGIRQNFEQDYVLSYVDRFGIKQKINVSWLYIYLKVRVRAQIYDNMMMESNIKKPLERKTPSGFICDIELLVI
jgi:hypothetical protein